GMWQASRPRVLPGGSKGIRERLARTGARPAGRARVLGAVASTPEPRRALGALVARWRPARLPRQEDPGPLRRRESPALRARGLAARREGRRGRRRPWNRDRARLGGRRGGGPRVSQVN